MSLVFAALLTVSSAFAQSREVDLDASDNLAVSLNAADTATQTVLLPVGIDPSAWAARAKADILVEALDGEVVALVLDATVLRSRPWAILPSTGQALVGIDPDEIDFDSSLKGIDPDEIDYDSSVEGIDPDEIDVYAMLKTGLDWLVVNPDGSVAGLLVAWPE